MRQMFVILMLMLMTSIALGAYQWLDYQAKLEADEDKVHMDVDLYDENKQMSVQIKITNLNRGNYFIKTPPFVEDFKCQSNDHQLCENLNTQLTLDQNKSFSITYKVSLDHSSRILINWLPKIYQDGNLVKHPITLTITKNNDSKSQWYTFKEPHYLESLEHITYKQWEFTNQDNIPFIALSGKYEQYYLNDHVSIFSTIPFNVEPFNDLLKRDYMIDNQIFVINPKLDPNLQEGVAILNHTEKRKIASALMTTQLLRSVEEKGKGIPLLLNTINSYLYSTDLSSKKAKFMVNELRQSLSDEQQQQWSKTLMEFDDTTTDLADYLDHSLENIGVKTTFFSQNANNKSSTPFYSVDQRDIKNPSRKNIKDFTAIIYRKKSYLPLRSLIESTGMKLVETNSEGILIKNGADRFRFYPERHLYIANELSYQFDDELLVRINNRLFINTHSASKIFPFTIQLKNNHIIIK